MTIILIITIKQIDSLNVGDNVDEDMFLFYISVTFMSVILNEIMFHTSW